MKTTIGLLGLILAFGWGVGAGCKGEQHCNDDSECLAMELCSAESLCVNNPCFNRVEGDFVECDGEDAVTCDASQMPVVTPCGQYGCTAGALGCAECVPGSGESCDGSDLITCGVDGLIEDSAFCATGCEELPGEPRRARAACPAPWAAMETTW